MSTLRESDFPFILKWQPKGNLYRSTKVVGAYVQQHQLWRDGRQRIISLHFDVDGGADQVRIRNCWEISRLPAGKRGGTHYRCRPTNGKSADADCIFMFRDGGVGFSKQTKKTARQKIRVWRKPAVVA